jgi:hypothetical protein
MLATFTMLIFNLRFTITTLQHQAGVRMTSKPFLPAVRYAAFAETERKRANAFPGRGHRDLGCAK